MNRRDGVSAGPILRGGLTAGRLIVIGSPRVRMLGERQGRCDEAAVIWIALNCASIPQLAERFPYELYRRATHHLSVIVAVIIIFSLHFCV
jgi:predicted ferric reductase